VSKSNLKAVDTQNCPALNIYVGRAEKAAALRGQVAALEAEIAKAEATEREALAAAPSLAPIDGKLEDVAADLALGQITDKVAEDRRAALAKERLAAEEKSRWATAGAGAARRTLDGLTRRLKNAQALIADIEQEAPYLRLYALREQAEIVGAEYVKHARIVRDAYLRLMALDGLMLRTGVKGDNCITYSTSQDFMLPSFKVAGVCDERQRERYHFDTLFTPTSLRYEVEEVLDAERRRLAALGLDL
jgi:hypothetical protein